MASSPVRHRSLQTLLGLLVTLTILLVLGGRAIWNYYNQRQQILAEMHHNSAQSLARLGKNIVPLIEAYAPGEYEQLITTEINLYPFRAIVLSDFHLGRVLGRKAYVSGKILDASGKIVDFDPNDAMHQRLVDQSFLADHALLHAADGTLLGRIDLYQSDDKLRTQLNTTLIDNILDALAVTVLLILLLGLLFHRLLLTPLQAIRNSLLSKDADGIPLAPPPATPYVELGALTDTLSHMLQEIRHARDNLQQQHTQLSNVISGANAGTWEWHIPSGSLSINARWAEMLGYTPEELTPATYATWKGSLHPEDLQRIQPLLEQHLSGTLPEFRSEFRMRHKDGHWVWILSIGRVAQRDAAGQPLLMSGTHLDISEKKRTEELIWRQANFDFLTGLPNRRLFIDRMEQELRKAARNKTRLALLFIDLNRFKEVNDTLGHQAGDELLMETARRIQAAVRASDTIGRMGGDEFTVLLPDIRETDAPYKIACNILEALKQPWQRQGKQTLHIDASIGIATYPDDAQTLDELLHLSDRAMYSAKQQGYGCIRLHQSQPLPGSTA